MLTTPTLTSDAIDCGHCQHGIRGERRGARPYHHGNLRETLVDAGTELARTGGPAAVVLRAVSREADVSHNAAYRHFADHEDLLAAVSARCMRQLGLLMTERIAGGTGRRQGPARLGQARGDRAGVHRVRHHRARLVPHRVRRRRSPRQVIDRLPPRRSGPAQPLHVLAARLDELVAVGALPPERRPGAEYAAWSAVHGLSTPARRRAATGHSGR